MTPSQTVLLPGWPPVASLAAHLGIGILVGLLYFSTLWRTARLFAEGGNAVTAVALTIGRFSVLGGSLSLAGLEGAGPLLALALGVRIARSVALRRFGRLAS